MKKPLLSLLTLLTLALSVSADSFTRVFYDGENTWIMDRSSRGSRSLDPNTPMAEHEVARLPYNYRLPQDFSHTETNEFGEFEVYIPVPQPHWDWNGTDIVALPQAERDAKDAAEEAERAAERANRPTLSIEQKILEHLGNINTKLNTTFSPPFAEGDSVVIKRTIEALLTALPLSDADRIEMNKELTMLMFEFSVLQKACEPCQYTDYFGQP